MRLPQLGLERELNTVVVLGAGASRGSSCARKIGVAPPLDADFFAQAQRMASAQLTKADRDLFNFIREEFGQGELPTLEVFFTQISAIDRFHHDFNIRGRPSGRFTRQLAALKQLVPRVFSEALGGKSCVWHERLVSAMRSNDAVISFNYDTLVDRALKDVGGNRWVPSLGYGFTTASVSESWIQVPYKGPAVGNPIYLLKPHGSLNWKIDATRREVALIDEYSDDTIDSIVPPSWDKSDVTNWPWSDVWRTSRTVLGRARLLIVVGYSVPVTDQLSQALLRADLTKIKALIVVNPDEVARRRIIELISSAFEANPVVVEMTSLEELASYLPASPHEAVARDHEAELTSVTKRLSQVLNRVATMNNTQSELARILEDMRDNLEEISERLYSLEESDLESEISGLRSEIRDVDSRLDSMTN
jgi:hypothetical protein